MQKEEALIEALRENWNHARHAENQRIHSLYIHGVIVAGVISILHYVEWNSLLGIFVLAFLAFFTFVLYCASLKWDAEFGNHMAAIRSISIKLGLIKKMEGSERNELKRKLELIKRSGLIKKKIVGIKKKLSELVQGLGLMSKLVNSEKEKVKRVLRETDIPEYAFIDEAYMALPLPLLIRVHRYLEFYYFIVIEISLILLAIVAAFSLFSSIFAINHLKLVIGVIVSIVSIIITIFVLWQIIRRGMKYQARVFKDRREPEEIKKRKKRES